MSTEPARESKTPRYLIPAVVAAVIIIAVAVVASGGKQDAAPVAEKAPTTEKSGEKTEAESAAELNKSTVADFVWHETPQPVAQTVFNDASEAELTLDKFKGKVLVVNFWATWCAPCVKEMPTLDALQAKLGGGDFAVVAISQDRDGAKVAKPFADKNGWKNLAFYVEKMGKFARDAQLRGLPTSLVVDKSGKEVGRIEGEVEWDSPEMEKILRDLIAKG
jgi:thiol-disulfide isomerase/thioredoxin